MNGGRRSRSRKTNEERLESLRTSVDSRINNLNGDRTQWVDICRKTLLDMETRNIHRRARHWTELVNEKIKDTNSRLSLDELIFNRTTEKFLYKVDNQSMNKHLGFIISWKGLKTRQIQNAPKTYLEFENKAKNWLNGRRAPNYAATLFPDMIKASEIYADYVSRQIFANNPKHSKMYCKICIIGFLSSLCSARISLNDASKKAYLICENSVKTGKTQVSQILQRYASDHPYQDKFPSHLREASDFFENKYMELISDFGIQLNQKKRKEKLDQAHAMGGDVLRIINNESNNSHSDGGNSNHDSRSVTSNPSLHSNPNSNRGGSEGGLPSSVTHSIMKDITDCHGNLNAISMSIDQFNKLAAFLSGMISNQKTQQSTINDLVSRVTQLESQQQKILNDVQSNSPRSPTSNYNDMTNGSQQVFNANRSVTSSNQSMNHQQPQRTQQRQFQMPNNPQPGTMQPGSNVNGNGSININAFQQRNVNNQQTQPRFSQQQSPKSSNLPNQGRLSPANSHTTKTTTSTNSIPSAQFNNGIMQMNSNGIKMTVQNINNSMNNNRNGNNNMNRMAMNNMNNMNNMMNGNNNMMNGNMNMNINNMMNNNMMNNNNGNQLQVPQMNNMSNITQNNFPVPQITNVNMNQLNRMNGMQQQQTNVNNMQTQQMNNNMNNMNNMGQFNNNMNNNNNNNQLNVPSIPGAATPAANMGNLPQPSNTLNNNNNGLPTTSLYGVGSYDSNDGDANMYGFGNNQSFNSSDAGMTNMMSIPNNGVQQQNQQQQVQQQVPLDAGYGMRFSDNSVNLQNMQNTTLQSIIQT